MSQESHSSRGQDTDSAGNAPTVGAPSDPGRHGTLPQDHEGTPVDAAGNAQTAVNNNRWVAEKKDVQSATDIRQAGPDGKPGHAPEEPGHVVVGQPHGPVSA